MAAQANFDPQPLNLAGKVARLEPLTLDHAPAMLEVAQDESIWDFFAVPAPTRLDEAAHWIEGRLADHSTGLRLPFAVICQADGKFAGSTGYSNINRPHRTLEIASWYGVAYQRTGINTECKYLLLKHAFEDLGALRVGLTVDVNNSRSRRAVERLGAVQEGIIRKQRIRRDGTHRDTVVFGFVDDDWPQVKQHLEELMNRY